MKIAIEINDDLIIKAKKLSRIKDESALIEKALQFFVTIETQKKLKDLLGKIQLDDEAFK
ncbi:MAG TPA: type II toxin-antitoxin system VapB family antitoxin [Mucilaginibacter sp.]